MAEPPDSATVDGPVRRRSSWNLKSIVEDVAGVPLADLQDPDRPVHPYVRAHLEHANAHRASESPAEAGGAEGPEDPFDPVARIYPPLTGATGRALHGAEHEHHTETLARHQSSPEGGRAHGGSARPPGPSRRPERIYLHYLLLHLDRLSDSALRYLKHSVDEELDHRGN